MAPLMKNAKYLKKEIDEIAAAASDAAILERLAKVKNIIVSLEEE